MRRSAFFALVFALSITVLPAAGFAAPPEAVVAGPPGSYIVVLDSGNPQAVADEHRRNHGAEVGHVYRHALRGYSARMSPQAAARVAADSRVDYVDVDRVVTTTHHQCGHVSGRGSGTCATGDVSGTVTDVADSGPIQGANVTAGAEDKTTATDENGAYTITGVSGTQTLTVTVDGYESAKETILVDGNTSVDFALEAISSEEPPTEPATPPATDYDVPLGLQRVFWSSSSAVNDDGLLAEVRYPGVAIIDTGIAEHADLPSIAGGYNCSSGPPHRWQDGNGHGTHVAGTVAAKGAIVGVAPGVPLYAVRVLGNAGTGSWADVICGVDWVTANAVGNGGPISVANMSLGGSTNTVSSCTNSSLHAAICNSVKADVTYVTSAGNSAADAKGFVPAAYPETITVAAIADFDGKPHGEAPLEGRCRTDVDDTHANFSNYGTVSTGWGHVDITAPGVCITSTWHDGGYHRISGTSMSGPHVAGAAAVVLGADAIADARGVLKTKGNKAYSYTWDGIKDVPGAQPPLLDLSDL